MVRPFDVVAADAMFGVALLAAILVGCPIRYVSFSPRACGRRGPDSIAPARDRLPRMCAGRGHGQGARSALHFALNEVRDWGTELRTLGQDLRTREQGLTKDDAVFDSQREIKTAEISQAESEVKFREQHAKSSRDLLERMEKLSKTGGISLVEVIQYRLEAAESEKDLSVAQRTLQQVKLEREQMEAEHSRQRAENVAEIEKLKMRLSALRDDLQNSQQNLLTVRAPYAGVVISQTQQNAGSVVQNGEELCQLAPNDAKARVRLTPGEASVPKLAKGSRCVSFSTPFLINAMAWSMQSSTGSARPPSLPRKVSISSPLLPSTNRN